MARAATVDEVQGLKKENTTLKDAYDKVVHVANQAGRKLKTVDENYSRVRNPEYQLLVNAGGSVVGAGVGFGIDYGVTWLANKFAPNWAGYIAGATNVAGGAGMYALASKVLHPADDSPSMAEDIVIGGGVGEAFFGLYRIGQTLWSGYNAKKAAAALQQQQYNAAMQQQQQAQAAADQAAQAQQAQANQ